ncbi:hypothetical protein MGMO_53c00550 [Methyloglobulus morosus KoM1]|uniref:Uncharacterized protein n=1 Tax=Methyloglobulus morosus KoM1 TaxID=1116472 RepID=V5DZ74_9GAMM|nr:hypothetical protein MGMO_53c00550 [Methyloglobulus morosus KoM1]
MTIQNSFYLYLIPKEMEKSRRFVSRNLTRQIYGVFWKILKVEFQTLVSTSNNPDLRYFTGESPISKLAAIFTFQRRSALLKSGG